MKHVKTQQRTVHARSMAVLSPSELTAVAGGGIKVPEAPEATGIKVPEQPIIAI